jgi:hypothetical protein
LEKKWGWGSHGSWVKVDVGRAGSPATFIKHMSVMYFAEVGREEFVGIKAREVAVKGDQWLMLLCEVRIACFCIDVIGGSGEGMEGFFWDLRGRM